MRQLREIARRGPSTPSRAGASTDPAGRRCHGSSRTIDGRSEARADPHRRRAEQRGYATSTTRVGTDPGCADPPAPLPGLPRRRGVPGTVRSGAGGHGRGWAPVQRLATRRQRLTGGTTPHCPAESGRTPVAPPPALQPAPEPTQDPEGVCASAHGTPGGTASVELRTRSIARVGQLRLAWLVRDSDAAARLPSVALRGRGPGPSAKQEERTRLDARDPAEGAADLRRQPMPNWAPTSRASTSITSSTS